jgi:hypothetical protein
MQHYPDALVVAGGTARVNGSIGALIIYRTETGKCRDQSADDASLASPASMNTHKKALKQAQGAATNMVSQRHSGAA